MSGRMLLVDDDETIREIATLSLERVGGWNVEVAASGEAALAAADERERFDAVLLDVMMPGLDGPATLTLLRERELIDDAVPVVFLTAKVPAGERERLLASGASGVIAKPFDPMSLPSELEEILGRHTNGD